jgi:hypothetical protein
MIQFYFSEGKKDGGSEEDCIKHTMGETKEPHGALLTDHGWPV